MPGYFIGVVNGVKDEAAFGAYQGVAMPTIEKYGGKMLWVSTGIEVADGSWAPQGMILFESESSEQARKWYNSPEYQAVVGQRISSTDSATAFIDV